MLQNLFIYLNHSLLKYEIAIRPVSSLKCTVQSKSLAYRMKITVEDILLLFQTTFTCCLMCSIYSKCHIQMLAELCDVMTWGQIIIPNP